MKPAVLYHDRDMMEQFCRMALRVEELPKGMQRVRCLSEFWIYLSQDSKAQHHECLRKDGFWENDLTYAISNVCTKGGVAIDVGANVGFLTIIMARCVGSNGRVLAIEPNPEVAELLACTVREADVKNQVQIIEKGCGMGIGAAELAVPANECDLGSICQHQEAATNGGKRYQIDITTIDELTKPLTRLDFIKMDIEGAERDAWHGMYETLKRFPNVQIAMEFAWDRQEDTAEWIEEMKTQGFSATFLKDPAEDPRLHPETKNYTEQESKAYVDGRCGTLWLKKIN